MIFKLKTVFPLLIFLWSGLSTAKISVLTSTANLAAIVKEVGGDEVSVFNFCKGNQDPHFLEARPSYMLKTSKADLVVAIGLGLEVGWLPKVLSGGRNPNVMPGSSGYLEIGPSLEVLDVPTGKVTRADGDVHPEGNPHVTLDPIRAAQTAQLIAQRLSLLDSKNASSYKERALSLKARLEKKTNAWAKRVETSGVKRVVTYHKTLAYFLDRFNIKTSAVLEPFPGVPPTGPHILSVINKAKSEGVKLILVENYFNDSVAKRVARDVSSITVGTVAVSVGGSPDIKIIDDVHENLVKTVEKGAMP